jgi:hypothetical protein
LQLVFFMRKGVKYHGLKDGKGELYTYFQRIIEAAITVEKALSIHLQ